MLEITREEAIKISDEVKNIRANPRLNRLIPFLKEAEKKVREAANNGRNRVSWTVGTNDFSEDILLALRRNGFIANYADFQFVVEW